MKSLMSRIIKSMLLMMSVFLGSAFAHESADIIVEHSFVRESIPGTKVSSAYMTLKNVSDHNLRLIAATSAISDRIELHEHIMENGMMKMRKRDNIEVAAHESTIFQPSGLHLMIFDLKAPLKAKENIMITLHFDNELSMNVNYPVKGLKQKQHHHH